MNLQTITITLPAPIYRRVKQKTQHFPSRNSKMSNSHILAKLLNRWQNNRVIEYNYIGPDDLLTLVCPENCGTLIMSPQDILNWGSPHNEVIATFVIQKEGHLCLADRHTEHVACAGGKAVLSAGEMTFFMTGSQIEVTYATNQSTGYCPEPTSWPAVAKALDKLAISHPNKFSHEFIFRRCMTCQTINIIKDEWYVCAVCGRKLN